MNILQQINTQEALMAELRFTQQRRRDPDDIVDVSMPRRRPICIYKQNTPPKEVVK